MDKDVLTNRENFKKFLVKKLGITDAQAEHIVASVDVRDIDLIEGRIKEICAYTGLSVKEYADIIVQDASLIGYSFHRIKQTYDYYKENYGFTFGEINKMVKTHTKVVLRSPETIAYKEEFYMKRYGLTKQEFGAKVKRSPRIIGASTESVEDLENFLLGEYGITRDSFAVLIRNCRNFPMENQETIKEREIFYLLEFGITKSNFAKILKSGKAISYGHDNVRETYMALNKGLNMTKREFAQLIIKCPSVIGFDPAATIAKFNKLYEMGFEFDEIMEYPKILTLNPMQMKIRYMLMHVVGGDEENFFKRDFMTSEDKVFARYMGLIEREKPLGYIYISEPKFNKKVNVTTKELMALYPLTESVKKHIEAVYNQKNPSRPLTLSQEELEYGK